MYLRFEFLGMYLQFQTGGVEEEEVVDEEGEETTPEPVNAGHPLVTYAQDYVEEVGFHMPP